MSTLSSASSKADWLHHKADIHRWYLVEKKSLKQVRQILELRGLIVTKDQLDLELKEWDFRKKLPQDA
ncbi:hypothetical protein B0H67DRAFT_642784 [Lasiosphaeris hirsuta]|uniref:Clr5 domain-containing protein n=1 Tax=Lasiosphaeris hirsuta TaxID=260670 RepID=A0AA40AP57_9PEZI|nr:hypothetical protein B0H67DRAFT_642784 [Lasiosphaeris hirsuta]